MSLSKIGKTSALTGALSDLLNNKGTLKNVNDSLLSFGNIDIAAAALAKASVGTGLSDANLTAMLQSAYGGTESAANAAGLAMSNALSSVEVAAPEASAAVSGISGAFATTKAAAVGFLSVMKSILPIAAIIGGAFVAGKLAWDNILTNNTVDKNYKNSSDKYDNAKSELTSLQTQYDTNKERIQELNAKQYLSSEERAEKNKLERENQLLDSQVSTGKNVVSASQKQKALDAQKTLDKSSYHKNYAGKQKNKVTDSQKLIYQDDLDQASDMIKQLDSLKSQRDEIINNRSKQSDSYFSAYQKEERKLKWLNEDISQLESDLSDNMSDISKNSESFWDDQGNLVDTTTKKTADRAASIIDYYNKVTGASDTTTDKLNNIFALDKFKDVENRLTSIGASGKKEDILNKISEIDGLQEALDKAGISAETLADNIMSVANPDKKNINGIKENLKDEFSYKDGLYNFFKDKSDKELENFWDYYTSQNLNAKKYDWNLDTVKSNFDQAQVAAEKTNPISTPFSSLFKNSAEDTATDLDTITDNFQTDMSNIKSSMDSIKSGTFQNSDITDLIQQFPELATETDNLQQGLQNLAFDKASDAIGKIRDSVKDVTDPKQLAAADQYIQSIMDTMDLSGFDMSNAKSAILGNLTKNLADKHMASVTTPNLVNQLMSEYGNDEIAVQAIMKLSLDPSMANADLDTWKSKIEDTKVQIQLDTSAKNLDNLSKELTRLQTDASDQQTRLNNKSAYNMKATASDYTNLIENGDKQIENLNNQIKEYQNNIDALKNSKGLSPLSDEDNEQIKQWQDQIQASQMSIENMKASQADWTKTAFNLPVTDMQNTVTALTSAISEMQTETGLTSDTMDSLRTQFSDLKDAHVDNVFDRTAKGLKINTERMKDYLEQQNEFMNSDFAQRIQDYQDQLSAGNKDYTQQGLENLKNLQAQYFAQYQEAAKQFSDFQAMVNADNLSTEGNEYTTAKSYLDNAKDLYDKGLVGTPQFKAAAKYFSQNGFEDADNFIENYNKLKNYYTDDASGPKRFLSDLEAKGLATYKTLEDGNQQWMYSFTDTQEAADAMGMSLESFESMFGRLKDYGDTNNFVSSLEEGALKSEEIDDKLIDAQIKMGKLKASGANQSALDDQQAVIDNLIAQKTGITQAISDFKDGTVDRKIQDIKDAKGAIDELNQAMKDQDINPDSDAGKKYIEAIQEQADKVGLKLTNFEVDEDAYNQLIAGYEAKAKGSQIKHFQDVNEGIESGNTGDYSDSDVELVNKIKDAQEQKSEALQNVIDAVNSLDKDQWNEANQIELGNGAYESEDQGIRNVEDALQGLSDQFGLTKEQATALLPALEALGVVNIDPNVDMTGLDELDQATQDGMASLRQMQAKGDIDLSFKIDSSTDGLTIDELQSQIDELEKAKVKLKLDVDSPEYNAIQSMIDQRETQIHLQVLMDQSTDIDKWLALANGKVLQKLTPVSLMAVHLLVIVHLIAQ